MTALTWHASVSAHIDVNGRLRDMSAVRSGMSGPIGVLLRVLPLAAAAAVGFVLAGSAWVVVAHWEDRIAQRDFAKIAEDQALALQHGLDEYLNKLAALRALFESSERVTRREFETFAARLLEDQSPIRNLSWVPRVSREERAEHERAARRDGVSGYSVKSVSADDRISIAPEKDEYLPIFYSTLPKTSVAYGIDLTSQPVVARPLARARDNNQLSCVPDFALHSTNGKQHGILFSLPVYRQDAPRDTLEDRRRNLVGFVHGAFLTAAMVARIIDTTTVAQPVDVYLYMADTGPDGAPLYVHPSRLRATPLEPQTRAELAAGPHWTGELKAGDARWSLIVAPIAAGPLATHDRAWLVFLIVALLDALVVSYLWAARRHADRLTVTNQKVSELAQKDALTGLANRRAFLDRLDLAFAASRRGADPFAVLCFDLDYFKDVNDTLGHPVGDALLREVARRLRGTVRSTDVVARFGGDEFAVLQADAASDTAAGILAAKIGATIAAPYSIDGNDVHVSASIGIARCTALTEGPQAIMMQADLALYRAKEDGRNCFRFHSPELDQATRDRVMIAEELRGARDRGELELYYQPQVELRSGRIVGFEALARWNHPIRGFIPPSTFIPIAERTGAILPFGSWTLDQACRQMHYWRAAGVAPPVLAVNLSALQFKAASDLERDVAASLRKWNVDPASIELELTETVLMQATEQYGDTLAGLRRLGVRLALDDFGTGYSSLDYLTKYPVNRLKVAQQLVFGVSSDARHATVVRTAIRLADELGIGCLAEGVETKVQADFLLAAGCEHAQGYYFSPPVTAEVATEMLRAGRIDPADTVAGAPPKAA